MYRLLYSEVDVNLVNICENSILTVLLTVQSAGRLEISAVLTRRQLKYNSK